MVWVMPKTMDGWHGIKVKESIPPFRFYPHPKNINICGFTNKHEFQLEPCLSPNPPPSINVLPTAQFKDISFLLPKATSSISTMSKRLQKFVDQRMKVRRFFQYCLSKLKNPRPQIHPSASLTRILAGCKQPKTRSIAVVRGNNAATLSDIDRFLFDNFKSLFLHEEDTSTNSSVTSRVSEENQGDSRSGSMSFDRTSLDILSDLSETSDSRENIVVLACSASQYEDLRRSMKEMVDRRLRNHGRVDWGFMEELLFCYLKLNERKAYKFILSAYVDLINGLRERSPARAPMMTKKEPKSVRTFRTGSEIKRKEKIEELTL